MITSLFGLKTWLPDRPSVDQLADFIKAGWPLLWQRYYTKHIEAPGSHCGFKLPAALLCTAILQEQRHPNHGVAVNISSAARTLEQWDFPTRYVSRPLLASLQHTHPPVNASWKDVAMPFGGLFFMLPLGALRDPDGEPINCLGVVRKRVTLFTRVSREIDDHVLVFHGLQGGGLDLYAVAFPATQPLEPSPGWLVEHIDARYGAKQPDRAGLEFECYLAGLVANFLLLMTARPELVERETSAPRKLLPKSGVLIVPACFIGRKYQIKREGARVPQGGHFTELVWRCGHYREQHFGRQRLETKTIWVEPYVCLGRGLVREAVANGPDGVTENPARILQQAAHASGMPVDDESFDKAADFLAEPVDKGEPPTR